MNKKVEEFVVRQPDAGRRADVYVAQKFPQFSRSALKGLFISQKVRVDGKPAKAGGKLNTGDRVAVEASLLFSEPELADLPIIYEDGDVTVINKPAGMLTHSKGAINTEPTVASFIKNRIADKSLTGNRAGVVHRLDRATSGVIVTAKNAKALKYLQKQFSTRKTKKIYFAVVEGAPKPVAAVIDAPIVRNPKKPQTFMVSSAGRAATTTYKVLRTIREDGLYSLVELVPQTGRTHQLRVHMAHIGHPVVGDTLYGHEKANMLLHARELELNLPNGKKQSFLAPIPKYFKGCTEA